MGLLKVGCKQGVTELSVLFSLKTLNAHNFKLLELHYASLNPAMMQWRLSQ